MAMIKCPKCDEEVSDKAEKCVHCGHKLIEEPKLFCVECGTEIKKMLKYAVNVVALLINKKIMNHKKLRLQK